MVDGASQTKVYFYEKQRIAINIAYSVAPKKYLKHY